MTFAPLGDSAVVVTLGLEIDDPTLARVGALAAAFGHDRPPGIDDVVPAATTVTVFYEPAAFGGVETSPYDHVCGVIAERAQKINLRKAGRTRRDRDAARAHDAAAVVEIPVCYGGAFGPDLEAVARHCQLRTSEVIALHSGAEYRVHAVGFAPGFPYLGGLPEKLHTPRRPTPRTCVPAGSIGIGWTQTGIYPLALPGGWQLIGRTPLTLFRPHEAEPARLHVGDRVTFRAIGAEEFDAWK
jgi:inhibitor of KinA